MDAAGRRGSEEPACDVRRRAQQAMFDETEKNARGKLRTLGLKRLPKLRTETGILRKK